MEFGVVLPQVRATWDDTLRFAQTAEEAGFDSVWLIDHLYGFPPQNGILEAWTVMSALAVSTTRVGIGAQVFCQSFRSPALMAKMATTFDHISGGRLRFLLGTGWHEPEYTGFGYPFPPPGERVGQLQDAVRIIRGMWSSGTDPFTYEGRHYQVKDVVNVPPPEREIPIGIGGRGDRVLDLIAREADEWNSPGVALGDYPSRVARFRDRLAAHGRQARQSLQIVFNPGEAEAPGALAMFNPALGLKGSVDQMTERAGELAELGVTGLYGIVAGRRGLEAMAEVLADLRGGLK